jgi:hypothetical protein
MQVLGVVLLAFFGCASWGLSSSALSAISGQPAAFWQTEKPLASPAQASSAPVPQQKIEEYRPGAGTQILGELPKSLNAKKLKVGDPVEVRLFQDLLFQGKVVIPKQAKVWGHVTQVALQSKENRGSQVGLVFDKVVLPNKKELPFEHPAVIVALAAPMRPNTIHTGNATDMPVIMSKGQDTGASLIAGMNSNSQLAGANLPGAAGVIHAADHGVIGLKGVSLDNSNPNFTTVRAEKGNLNLDFDVQVLLQVSGNHPPKQ